MIDNLKVYLGTAHVGNLSVGAKRQLQFQYEQAWLEYANAIPISLSLPLNQTNYENDESRPFFENLLPEGESRKIIAKEFGLSEKNIYGLLEAIGGDCAGAVSLWPSELPENNQNLKLQLLNHEDLEKIIAKLPKHPLMASRKLRLSLAGVQEKLLIYVSNDKFYLPNVQNPSSHILKPPITHFEHTVANEYFCMKLADLFGLPVPKVALIRLKMPIYMIERYDRILNKNKQLERVHQEDFCQAMGILSEQKYQSEGGPSLKKCFEYLKKYSIQPALDIHNLIRWVIFNFLIGNNDAHGKNLAFLFTERGPKLSPFFDILSIEVYPELSRNLAMKIGGEKRTAWLMKRQWKKFSDEIEIKFDIIESSIQDFYRIYSNEQIKIQQLFEVFTKEEQIIIKKIIILIEKRFARLMMNQNEPPPLS